MRFIFPVDSLSLFRAVGLVVGYSVYDIIHGVSDVEVIEKISSSPCHCSRPLKQNNPSDLQIILALVVVAGLQFPSSGSRVQRGLQRLVEKDAWAWYVVHCCQCVRRHYIVSLSASTLFFFKSVFGVCDHLIPMRCFCHYLK